MAAANTSKAAGHAGPLAARFADREDFPGNDWKNA